jgi:hypothetical protein
MKTLTWQSILAWAIGNDVTNRFGDPSFLQLEKSASKTQYLAVFDAIFKHRLLRDVIGGK